MKMHQQHSFSVFPLDVWDILLNKYVTDAKSWLSCMYASKAFQMDELTYKLKQNKVIRLLPEVLTILQTKTKRSYLNDEDFKNLRLVNHKWHFAVGKFSIQSLLSNRHVCGPTPRIWVFQQNIDEMLAHFASSDPKLHLVKSFHIAEDLEFEDLEKVTKLLEVIGPSIRGLTWCTGTYNKYGILTGSQWYYIFRNWLTIVPNLEHLQISVVLLQDFEDLMEKYEAFSNEINKQMNLYNLPNLKKLLKLKVDDYVPTELVNVFRVQNPDIQVVGI